MKREIIKTGDGSTSIYLPEWNESYHSKHGAIQEAYHVFIKNGLKLFENQSVAILEIGFGTGLNAFITAIEAPKLGQTINYTGIEGYPVASEELIKMNYASELNSNNMQAIFEFIHEVEWEKPIEITNEFILTKHNQFFESIDFKNQFNLIYFDAFGYRVQPELWSTEIFKKMYDSLKVEGVLVTYAARSCIMKSMIEVGFIVEKLPGAPGKREMFRARKN